jgi:predicted acetylornithine/succinylornithine family transaminase
MKTQTNPFLKTELKHFLHTFKRQPLLLTKAKGSNVWDSRGRKYLDFFSGLAVCGVGHNNSNVIKAVRAQAGKLIHSSNYFYTEPQSALAKALTAKYKGSRVFFANSGAESNELAIKLARLWAAKNKKPGRDIITFQNAFHGRTLATAAASRGKNRSHDVFEPLPKGFKAVPYNDLEKTKRAIDKNTIAILVEPVQGEGGIHIASKEFFRGLAALCRKKNLLLIVDEIQSGMGRTGKFFAFEHYGVHPDIVTLAKGLAGGLPLGATLASPRVAQHMVPGLHGSTFGGNPVACAASLEVLKLLGSQALQTIRNSGQELKKELSRFSQYPALKEVRSFGLMVGMELNENGDAYVTLARERGLLINCTQGNVLRFLPPYFMTQTDLQRGIRILRSVFQTLGRNKN